MSEPANNIVAVDFSNTPIVLSINDQNIADLQEKYAEVPDANTEDGLEDLKEGKKVMTKMRTTLETARKELKSSALEFGKQVDERAKELSSGIEKVEKPYKDALDAHKAAQEAAEAAEREKEEERIANIANGINNIRRAGESVVGADSDALRKDLEFLNNMEVTEALFQEFFDQASDTQAATRLKIQTALEERIKYEAQEAELEEFRKEKAEREEREATEKKEAKEKQDAEDKRIAEENAKQLAIETEAREAAEAEAKRLQDEKDAKEAKELADKKKKQAEARKLARAPDAEKLKAYIEAIKAFADSADNMKLKDEQCVNVLSECQNDLRLVAENTESLIDTLDL